MYIIAEEVSSQPIERSPDDAPKRVVEQEGSPWHAVGPGQERGPGTQEGDKAPKEDHFAAMLAEEVLPQFHFALVEAKVMTVAAQKAVAAFTSNPVAQIIAYNRPQGRRSDHQRNGEAVSRPGIDGGHEQHGLARKGYSHTLDGHKEQHRPIAIDRQKMHQLGCGKMEHAVLLSPPPLTKSPLLPLLWLSPSCSDGHLLWLTLVTCEGDTLRFARFTDRKHNREDPILEF